MLAGDDLGFGMFRMWELIREDVDYQVMVFRDYDKAIEWLSSEISSSIPQES
ncbi:MAG: hypothetical protein KJ626_06450 [Verrucomicrobia bacterium]|nr:hypothetical protein [Verrucomicrobiota bacterium]